MNIMSIKIVAIALHITILAIGTIAGLVYFWPSGNTSANTVNGLKINSVLPSSGSMKENTDVNIYGAGFTDKTKVFFNNVQATSVKIIDKTHLKARSPTHRKQGIVDVEVENSDQKKRVLSPGFFYFDPQTKDSLPKPSITSLSPNIGPLSGGQRVTIKGNGFTYATMVSFGGFPATKIQFLDDKTLVVTTPSHGEGKVDVTVDAGAPTIEPARLQQGYTYTHWFIMPSHLFLMAVLAGALGGCVHGLRSLVWHVGKRQLQTSWLLKYYLLPLLGAALAVIFFLAASAGFYTVQGSGNLILIGLAGLVGMFSDQAAEKLKKIAEGLLAEVKNTTSPESTPVTVIAIAPNFGSTAGNNEITISGTGFDDTPQVRFGNKNAIVTKKFDDTSITVTAPAHTVGKVDVLVINKDGQSFMMRDGYEYTDSSENSAEPQT